MNQDFCDVKCEYRLPICDSKVFLLNTAKYIIVE